MKQRMNYFEMAPQLGQKLMELGQGLKSGSLDKILIDLVQIRASQLNGCTFCVDMHVKEAKIHGERELRLHHISTWRESTLFSLKERAALLFAEELTGLTYKGISDELYDRVRENFTDKEMVELTYAVGIINIWNRLNATFQPIHGTLDKMLDLEKAGLR